MHSYLYVTLWCTKTTTKQKTWANWKSKRRNRAVATVLLMFYFTKLKSEQSWFSCIVNIQTSLHMHVTWSPHPQNPLSHWRPAKSEDLSWTSQLQSRGSIKLYRRWRTINTTSASMTITFGHTSNASYLLCCFKVWWFSAGRSSRSGEGGVMCCSGAPSTRKWEHTFGKQTPALSACNECNSLQWHSKDGGRL